MAAMIGLRSEWIGWWQMLICELYLDKMDVMIASFRFPMSRGGGVLKEQFTEKDVPRKHTKSDRNQMKNRRKLLLCLMLLEKASGGAWCCWGRFEGVRSTRWWLSFTSYSLSFFSLAQSPVRIKWCLTSCVWPTKRQHPPSVSYQQSEN